MTTWKEVFLAIIMVLLYACMCILIFQVTPVPKEPSIFGFDIVKVGFALAFASLFFYAGWVFRYKKGDGGIPIPIKAVIVSLFWIGVLNRFFIPPIKMSITPESWMLIFLPPGVILILIMIFFAGFAWLTNELPWQK